MDNLLVKWNGKYKIKGIITLRTVFNLTLREAVHILNSDDGFVVSALQWIALRGEYMLHAEPGEGGGLPDRYINDWMVEPYVQAIPAWLVDKPVRDF